MTLRNRWGVLERAAQLYNERQGAHLVALLCAMTAKAMRVAASAGANATLILQRLQREQPSDEAAEYAKLRLQREYITRTASGNCHLPPAADLFDVGTSERLAPGTAALRNMDSRLRQLEGRLYEGTAPALDSPAFAAAVAKLAQGEIERLQESLLRKAQQVSA